MQVGPNFIVLGVAKGGTTSFHNYLQQHPDIYLTPIKETNYFARKALDPNKFRPAFKAASTIDVEKYVNGDMQNTVHMANVFSTEHYEKLYKNAGSAKALGEVCTSYFMVNESMLQIKEELPNAKVAVILRNPIERAFSGYVMAVKLGQIINKDFLTAVKEDYNAQPKGYGITFNFLEGGLYADSLKLMFETFSEEQRKVVLYDNYSQDVSGTLKSFFKFIGVDANIDIDTSQKSNAGGMPRFKWLNYIAYQMGWARQMARNLLPKSIKQKLAKTMYKEGSKPAMSANEKAWLIDFFRQDVNKTAKILGADLSHWLT